MTTTLINGEARDEVRSLLAEQETLRRVATLIAKEASPDTVFATVCDEAAALFGAEQAAAVRLEADEPSLVVVGLSALLAGASAGMRGITIGMRSGLGEWPTTTAACRTGRAARRDVTAEQTPGTGPIPDLIRAAGFLSTVSAPIFVDGRVWGAMVVSDSRRVLPADTERRIESFTELIATAIANREAREALAVSEARARALANEQAALRRVATLAARESSPVEILEAVAEEAARVLEVNAIGMLRFEPDATATLVAQSETPWPPPPLGTSFTLEGENIVASVHRTGRAARMDDWESATGAVAGLASVLGIHSAVASPIVVEGRLWGTMVAASDQSKPLPADTESRIVEFTELLATAISNAESREALTRLADEQAALRRVATLVAEGAAPDRVFDAVLHEVELMFNQPITALMRYDADGFATVLSSTGGYLEAKGPRWPVDGDGVVARVRESGRAAHVDYTAGTLGALAEAAWGEGLRHGIGVPVVVDGAVWGVMAVGARAPVAVAGEFERRVEKLTELLATAIANATTHADLLQSRARVVSAADETRRRLERDLHDGIQQWLVALALKARKAAGLAAAGESPVQELSSLADDLVEVTEELREISHGIHPAILSDAGLDDALQALARRSAIRVDLDVSFEGRYDPTLEATV
ncbi:MAG: GAF domain-containing protein, partial [Gaiellaceae bacterium]